MIDGTPVLKRLEEKGVLMVDTLNQPDGTGLRFVDGCDRYFIEVLTVDEVRALADELLYLANWVEKGNPIP